MEKHLYWHVFWVIWFVICVVANWACWEAKADKTHLYFVFLCIPPLLIELWWLCGSIAARVHPFPEEETKESKDD